MTLAYEYYQMHISFQEYPKGWLTVSHKPPSSCRRRNPRKFCSHDSDLQMPMWFWQSVCFLCQETDTWNDEPPKLPQRLSDFHDLRVVQTSLQAIGSNMKSASRTCFHHTCERDS